MQETTFILLNQLDGSDQFDSTHLWLDALYESASIKEIDRNIFFNHVTKTIRLEKLEKKLNYKFKNTHYLVESLIQSTFVYENTVLNLESNERLEFIGDSLVNLIIGKKIFKKFPQHNEGDLSKLRGALVNEEKLAQLARIVDLGEFLFLGKGEWKSQGRDKDSILADALEALMAVIYYDSNENLAVVEEVIESIVKKLENNSQIDFFSMAQIETFDPKSKLQEITMSKYGSLPAYKAQEVSPQVGFKVEVWIEGKKILEEVGVSKKKLEKKLAKIIIEKELY